MCVYSLERHQKSMRRQLLTLAPAHLVWVVIHPLVRLLFRADCLALAERLPLQFSPVLVAWLPA